jgi:hypothetical protein
MGLPPVVVGLVVSIFLWRTGPLGSLHLLFTPQAMVIAQFLVALPIAAGLTRSTLGLVDRDILHAMRVDGAGEARVARELMRVVAPQMLVVLAVAFACHLRGRSVADGGRQPPGADADSDHGDHAGPARSSRSHRALLLGLTCRKRRASWRERLLTVRGAVPFFKCLPSPADAAQS